MKESKKCGIISLVCVFLAAISLAEVVYGAIRGRWGSVAWNGVNATVGVFLYGGFNKLRKYFIKYGD